MQKILVIDNYDSFTFNLVQCIKTNHGNNVDVFRNDQITLEKIEQYDTIILSPGPGLPRDAGLLNDIIETYGPTKKILGVCLGMQAIAEVYGGSLNNLTRVMHGVSTPISVLDEKDMLFKNLPRSFNIGRYHSWVVAREKFPKELKITSVDEDGQIMSLKHKKFSLYGVQFHPESILSEHGQQLINNFLSN